MKNNNDKLPSWKEAYQVNQKAFKLIYKHYPQMFLSRIVSVIWGAITPYVGIYLSALLIEELSTTRNPERLTKIVIAVLVSAAVISLVSAFINKWKNIQGAGLWYKIRDIQNRKLLDMDFASVDDTKTHELLLTIKQNQNGGGWGLNKVIYNYESLLSNVITLFGGIALTVTLFTTSVPESAGKLVFLNNPLFIIAVIAIMVGITYLSPFFSNKAGSYSARRAGNHNLANRLFGYFGWLGANASLAADIRMYRQDIICDKHNSDKYQTFGSKGPFAKIARGPQGLLYAASSAVSLVFTGFVYAFVCLKAWGGAFGVGMVTQYISSISKLSGSLAAIIRELGDMRNNTPFLNLVFDFLELPNTMEQGDAPVEKLSNDKYVIEFKNVSFKYPGSENYVLKNISMKFYAGERHAVVGQNGSGKTTFIKLLCRLYDPTEGEILLNGRNIREYDYHEYMNIFSVVFQDFKLLAFTLGQNVGTGEEFDRELAESCLEKADFGERLKTMEQGLDTYLYRQFSKNGIEISGGEAQKIAIARALYKNSPFIILDEPTAALDPIAESEVYSNFNDIVGDKTAIYISHRLSSCRFCSDIIVFHEGKLVQRGSHEALLEDASGKYYELWNAQAQYYKA